MILSLSDKELLMKRGKSAGDHTIDWIEIRRKPDAPNNPLFVYIQANRTSDNVKVLFFFGYTDNSSLAFTLMDAQSSQAKVQNITMDSSTSHDRALINGVHNSAGTATRSNFLDLVSFVIESSVNAFSIISKGKAIKKVKTKKNTYNIE
jgi:hypothetical protein